MCGRYRLVFKDSKLSKQILAQTKKLIGTFKTADVYPGNDVLVFVPLANGKIDVAIKKWGIRSHSLLINARIETINLTPTYKKIINNRCVVVASGFYEWRDEVKFYLDKDTDEFIYLAAIYNDQNECVILTQESYGKAKTIHDRLPVIYDKKEMLAYLLKGDFQTSQKELLITPTQMSALF